MDILETAKRSRIEGIAILWNIHPQRALVANGAAALQHEAEEIPRAGGWRKVHIASRQIRRAIMVCQGKEINLIRRVHGDFLISD